MSWDETLFGWLFGAAKRLRAPRISEEELERRAELEPLRARLRLLASALAERPITVHTAEGAGSWRGDVLSLPLHLDLARTRHENELAYVVRVSWTTTAMRLGLELPSAADEATRALEAAAHLGAVQAALEEELPAAAEAMRALLLPALARRAERASPRQAALDAWVASQLDVRIEVGPAERAFADAASLLGPEGRLARWRALPGPATAFPLLGGLGSAAEGELDARPGASEEALPSGSEREGKAREHIRRVELPDDPIEDNPLVHSFEKVHTAEEYQGGVKNQDGEDELADHAEALDELDMREVVRSLERTRSLLRVDTMLEGTVGDVDDDAAGGGIPYPEWDRRRGGYREAWCHVKAGALPSRVERRAAEAEVARRAAALRREHEALRAELERLEASRRWRGRQLDGQEIDDDAVVDRHACVAAGSTPPERLYRARRPAAPSLAALVLLDGSLSTDGWVDDVRVLDQEIDAAVVLGEALGHFNVELAMASFHSHTRRDCRFEVVKSFREPWERARHRLADLEPRGYTRIGPALRHATHLLDGLDARRRLLLVLTDGKPNDYDRYEGRHGVADVRQAVREAEARGVWVHAFAIDREARFHLPRMLGKDRHHLLRHPRELPRAMGEVLTTMRA
ncbi:MAG: VWA domain-containing protein [Myxococcales bacterium]|nr:VWA domain-containing protein [Myxococcales bacterium]